MINSIASALLYVPFNKDYVVDDTVKGMLSEEEFFEHCFVEMDIIKEIENTRQMRREEFEEGEEGISGEELRREKLAELESIKDSIYNFNRWIKDSGNAVYCIKGNAGCGKSTYLHYLRYIYKNASIKWEIIDIQKSRECVDVLNRKLQIPKFQMLDYKVISAMLDNILQYVFIRDNNRFDFEMIKNRLCKLYQSYRDKIQEDFPDDITKLFFDNSPLFNMEIDEIEKSNIEDYANNIYKYLDNLINNENAFMILANLWSVYMCILNALDNQEKHIIAFDNFERFIGADEICNKQLWNFIETLRHLLQSCEEFDTNFHEHFQMILFMRNTTSRMGNLPLQLVDFGGHELDLSNWFPINRIIDKKIKWYKTNLIEIPNSKLIDLILGDASFDGKGMRSLQTKLSMLFNNNKRTLILLLSHAINDDNKIYLEKFRKFTEDTKPNHISLNKFAGRSIIIRLLLDELQKDHFFRNIFVEDDEETYQRLGIARKLLTILYNYSLTHHQGYMPIDDLIREFRNEGNQSIERFFDANYQGERSVISKILYHMNYYNSRKNEWIQFVDIQYNVNNDNMVFYVEDANALEKMIEDYHSEIGIRIMLAGKAYLHYLVQSFEYFACRIDRRKKKEIPPLLTLIPEEEELNNCTDVLNLEFFNIIDKVFEDASNCIMRMQGISDNDRILYRRTAHSLQKKHSNRIIDSHRGYINNFQQCIKKKYEDISLSNDNEVKLQKIYEELDERKRRYTQLQDE